MRSPKKTGRRSFVKGLGMAAAALPLFNILKLPRAGAATSVAPLRLITLWSPFQVPELYYHPQNSSGGMATAGSDFNLTFTNSVLAPLAPFQKQLLLFRGLNYGNGPNSHTSNGSVFTGANSTVDSASEAQTNGTSIEQYLYTRMGQAGSLSPINAGLLTYYYSDHVYDSATSWNNGKAVAMVGNPADILKNYFANFTPPSSSGSKPDPQIAAALARRQRSLGIAKNGLDSLMSQLPSTSASLAKLQQHQTAMAGLISSLSSSGSTLSLASCTVPTSSNITADSSDTMSQVTTDFTSFSTLISEAFACDITRFASIKMSNSDDSAGDVDQYIPGLSAYKGGDFHGGISHTATDKASNDSDTKMAEYKVFWYGLVAKLLTQLQGIADPYSPSQSLLDNTVVLVGSEGPIQTPSSDLHGNGAADQAMFVAGGCGGAFNMGRLIDVRSMGKVVNSAGITHNALLTNIVNAFENNQKAFNPSFTPKILTQYGDYSFPVDASTWLST